MAILAPARGSALWLDTNGQALFGNQPTLVAFLAMQAMVQLQAHEEVWL
jgi:hypothetical protein